MSVTPNQSYLVKNMQWRIAAALAVLMNDQHANIKAGWHAYAKQPNDVLFWPSAWRQDSQLFKARLAESKSGLHASMILFRDARWDSQRSDLDYGDKSIDHAVNERDDAKTKIIHNNTSGELHVSYEEAVELTNSFSSSITKGVTLDMTKEASVDTSLTVKGEYAGVGAEASVAAHFGVSESRQQSSEEGKEKSEEGTHSESLAIEFDAKPRSYYLVEVKKENAHTSQPFDIDGVMDFDIHLTYSRWDGHTEHRWTRQFAGVDALEQYVHGYDTDHPEMAHYWDKAPDHVKAAIAFIMDPANRRIQVSGINQASLDSNATYDVELLGDHVPEAVAHLPVVAAENA